MKGWGIERERRLSGWEQDEPGWFSSDPVAYRVSLDLQWIRKAMSLYSHWRPVPVLVFVQETSFTSCTSCAAVPIRKSKTVHPHISQVCFCTLVCCLAFLRCHFLICTRQLQLAKGVAVSLECKAAVLPAVQGPLADKATEIPVLSLFPTEARLKLRSKGRSE